MINDEGKSLLVAGEIGPESLKALWEFLGEANAREVWLCSGGGVWTDALAMIDLIRMAALETVAVGEVASSAAVILAAGARRFITPSTMVGLHEPSWGGLGEVSGMWSQNRAAMDSTIDRFYSLLGALTKHTPKWWRERLNGHGMIWLDAKEAVKWGLADEVESM